MIRVSCKNTECTGYKDGYCEREVITIGDNEEFICEDYQHYSKTAQYQNPYFICVKSKDNKVAKALKQGKRIEFKGYIFFTEDDDRRPEVLTVTEQKTGLKVGFFEMLKDDDVWEKFIEIVNKNPDVSDYPLAEWDDWSRKYVLKEGNGDSGEKEK